MDISWQLQLMQLQCLDVQERIWTNVGDAVLHCVRCCYCSEILGNTELLPIFKIKPLMVYLL